MLCQKTQTLTEKPPALAAIILFRREGRGTEKGPTRILPLKNNSLNLEHNQGKREDKRRRSCNISGGKAPQNTKGREGGRDRGGEQGSR